MTSNSYEGRRRLEMLPRAQLAEHQLARLNAQLAAILPHNRFYAEKLADVSLPLASLDDLAKLPYTFKEELIVDDHEGDLAVNLTWPASEYVRFHRTSGTRGRPLVVLDTADDWRWWQDTWQFVLDAAEVTAADRALLAFSFGPFIGFWSAFDALVQRGALAIPCGGMSTPARLDLLQTSRSTVLFCTPSYALHMAEVAAEQKYDVAGSGIRSIIVAGEPGGSLPAVRERIEQAWDARVIDHAGATEIGPWGYADAEQRGLRIVESEFIPEFLSVDGGGPAAEGEVAELVLTSLGRTGAPVIRYRTGDLVRARWPENGTNRFVLLEGGVLGRTDDMMVIRGVNIFPSSIEQILRGFPEIVEYRMTARRVQEMDQLTVEIEDRLDDAERVAKELKLRLGLRIAVECVPLGTLPRYEAKGARFVDERGSTNQA